MGNLQAKETVFRLPRTAIAQQKQRDMEAKCNVCLHKSNKIANLHGEVMELSCWDVLLGCRPPIMEAGQRESKALVL